MSGNQFVIFILVVLYVALFIPLIFMMTKDELGCLTENYKTLRQRFGTSQKTYVVAGRLGALHLVGPFIRLELYEKGFIASFCRKAEYIDYDDVELSKCGWYRRLDVKRRDIKFIIYSKDCYDFINNKKERVCNLK